MSDDFRRQVLREFPELAAGYHLPVMAEVTAIPDAPDTGGIADNYRPRLAVDVVLINSRDETTDIQLQGVPVSITGGGHQRGLFALPNVGTLVEIAWFAGSPERPFVRSILGERQALPELQQGAMSWQQNQHQRQHIDQSGNWTRETDQTITDTASQLHQMAHQLTQQLGQKNTRIHGHDRTDITGESRTEAAAIHLLAETVINLLAAGSVNTVAGQHITHNAGGDIRQHAGGDASHTAANITHTATESASITAPQIHIGTDQTNILKILSDTLAQLSSVLTEISALTVGCTGPGNASSPPVNAAKFTAAAAAVDTLKTSLDGMIK